MIRHSHITALISLAATLVAPLLIHAETHVVTVGDNFFSPNEITIAPGDTIRWETTASTFGGHNVDSDQALWAAPAVRTHPWSFEHTFANEGDFGYHCDPHQGFGMVGTVSVSAGGGEEPGIDINAGQNGNWWSGPSRNGEGAQVEISNAGGGELVVVILLYAYNINGEQVFLIMVGTPDGDTAELEVFITDGGMWGDDFDPNDVSETPWGTGTFKSNTCDSVELTLVPNAEQMAAGFTEVTLDLIRLTSPVIDCPLE